MDSSVENTSFVQAKKKPKPKRVKRTISTPFMIKGKYQEFECPLSPLEGNADDSLAHLLQDVWVETEMPPQPAPKPQLLQVPAQKLNSTLDRFLDNYDNTSVLRQISILKKMPSKKPKKISNKSKKSSVAGQRKKKQDYPDVEKWIAATRGKYDCLNW